MSEETYREQNKSMKWVESATHEEARRHEVLAFDDYIEIFNEHAERECRPSFLYMQDMINHFGKDEKGKYKIFNMDHVDASAVYGQHKVEEALVQNLLDFSEEGFNNRFILLVGPNGSSKSSIVRKLMKGMEEYSKTDDGSIYSFSWVFPIDNLIKGAVGLSTSSRSDINSFAYLEEKEITAILNSELKDHPLLLIPVEYRQKIIADKLAHKPKLLATIKKSYLYNGDISKRNRMIYDALLKNYKGRHSDVLKHIRVERFNISRRYSTSAVTVEPQIHIDANIQQITIDKRLASLPSSLQSLNLFSLTGEAVLANRGILEFSDLLKRPLDAYKYLITTMETRNINISGILTELDIFFIGTSNEIHLAAFKQHPDFNSFKGRFNFVTVPYLMDVNEELKIYKNQVKSLADNTTFEPHALFSLCVFAIMSRLRCPQSKHYSDKKLGDIVTNLNPLEKALMIAKIEMPEGLDLESQQILNNKLNDIMNEYANENLYEGKFGLSPRELKKAIYKIARNNEHITFIEVIDYLNKLITEKNTHDFLNMNPQLDYHHPARFIALINEYCLNILDKEVRDSLGMIDDRSYENYIKKYIENITAMMKGEKIKNPITGIFEECDHFFIKEFESNIQLNEDPKNFRSQLLSQIGAYSLDHPGEELQYIKVFSDLEKKLKESFRKEQEAVLKNIARNLVLYQAEIAEKDDTHSFNSLPKEGRETIKKTLSNLQNKYNYSQKSAISLLRYLLKKRY